MNVGLPRPSIALLIPILENVATPCGSIRRVPHRRLRGHPTSCFSMAEIMALFFAETASTPDPKNPDSDVSCCRGHAAPILRRWAEAGVRSQPAPETARDRPDPRTSDAMAHPDVPTGSSVGHRVARPLTAPDRRTAPTLARRGRPAAAGGGKRRIDRQARKPVRITDVNALGQAARDVRHDGALVAPNAFGWHAMVVDGHDLESDPTRSTAKRPGQPTMFWPHDRGKGVCSSKARTAGTAPFKKRDEMTARRGSRRRCAGPVGAPIPPA